MSDRLTPGEARRKNHEAFQAFWRAYPRRIAIREAERVFSEIVEGTLSRPGVDPNLLITKAKAYARTVDPNDLQYVPAPHSWLKQGRYEDMDLFTDQTQAEKEWLKGCWYRCDVKAVEDKYHITMPRVNLPEGMDDPKTIREWYRGQAQLWIAEVAKGINGTADA